MSIGLTCNKSTFRPDFNVVLVSPCYTCSSYTEHARVQTRYSQTMKFIARAFLVTLVVLSCARASHAHEFVFARLVYSQSLFDDWPRWRADWPEAETHFNAGLQRLTRLDVAPDGVLMRMNDDTVFDYPWLYVVEVGSMTLSTSEAATLREYLLRGGFMMVDDFHGRYEWQQFEAVMKQVFPNKQIEDLSDQHEAFHVLYNLESREQIPGIRALMNNRTHEKGGTVPRWRGIVDESNRVMVAINFNQDIGDAWEHADDARYPASLTAQAYRLGVNYVLYSLTH